MRLTGKRKHINRKRILRRDGWICQYCGGPATEVEHIIPVAYKDIPDEKNLVATCRVCNRLAGSRLFDSFEAKKAYILERRKNGKARPHGDPCVRAAPPVEVVRIKDFHPSITGADIRALWEELHINFFAFCWSLTRILDPSAKRGFTRVYIHQMISGSREITPTIETAYKALRAHVDLMKARAEKYGWVEVRLAGAGVLPYVLVGNGAKFEVCECGNVYWKRTPNQSSCGKCGQVVMDYFSWHYRQHNFVPVFMEEKAASRFELAWWRQIMNFDGMVRTRLAELKLPIHPHGRGLRGSCA